MELEWSKKKLLELVRKAYHGEVMLPDFQRNFVWARNDIEELICSLLEKNVYRYIPYTASKSNGCSF